MPWLLTALGGGATATAGVSAGATMADAAASMAPALNTGGALAAAAPAAGAPSALSSFMASIPGLYDRPLPEGMAGPPSPGLTTMAGQAANTAANNPLEAVAGAQRMAGQAPPPGAPPGPGRSSGPGPSMPPPMIPGQAPQAPPSNFSIEPSGRIAYKRPILPTIGG